MKKLKELPRPLLRSVIIPPLISACFLAVGIAVFLYNRDKLTLTLSALIAVWSAVRTAGTYRAASNMEYEKFYCVCISIVPRFMRRRFEVTLMGEQGKEVVLLLEKGHGFQPGQWYNVFFASELKASEDNSFLKPFLQSSTLLGHELASAPVESEK